jgi:hypothetical protein
LDALQVPDEVCAHFKDLGDYDYRPAREVADADENTEVRSVIDVDILGHMSFATPGCRNCADNAPSSTSTGRFSNTTSTAWT